MSCAIAHACLHTCLNLLRCGFYFIPQTDMNSLWQAVFWMPKLPFYVTLSIHSSNCLPIHRTAYLRKCTSCDHNFWYTCVKWYLQAFFFFFFFKKWFFGLLEGAKKNSPKWQKFCLLCFLYQEPNIILLSFMVHLCELMLFQAFSLIFQNVNFLEG